MNGLENTEEEQAAYRADSAAVEERIRERGLVTTNTTGRPLESFMFEFMWPEVAIR